MATPVNITSNKKSVQKETTPEPPLVVIVGPTASGKTATAIRIAEEWGGEIICADSRTIYKGLDIGTAKPTAEEQARVPHWGLDLVDPGEHFTAADFKQYAKQKIVEIRSRGHLPILVGGTGLYIDGVIFDYTFAKTDLLERDALEQLSLEDLQAYCANNNVTLPENQQNRRHLIQAILRKTISVKRLSAPLPNTIIVGITTDRDILRQRIIDRAEHLFENGMVTEAIKMGDQYGWHSEAMTGNIYRLTKQFLDGDFDQAELRRRFITSDWQLAKRQLTWLKRNPFIHWESLEDAYIYIKKQLTLPAGSE